MVDGYTMGHAVSASPAASWNAFYNASVLFLFLDLHIGKPNFFIYVEFYRND